MTFSREHYVSIRGGERLSQARWRSRYTIRSSNARGEAPRRLAGTFRAQTQAFRGKSRNAMKNGSPGSRRHYVGGVELGREQ